MADAKSEILSRKITNSGEKISVRSLEDSIHKVRNRQNV